MKSRDWFTAAAAAMLKAASRAVASTASKAVTVAFTASKAVITTAASVASKAASRAVASTASKAAITAAAITVFLRDLRVLRGFLILKSACMMAATVAVFAITATLFTSCVTIKNNDRFTVELSSPNYPAGEIELQIDKPFPLTGLKKIAVAVSYFPYDDAVCLRYRSDFYNYHQFWSKEGRDMYLKSLNQYYIDYNDRTLNAKNKKSKKAYGVTEGYLIWQMFNLAKRVSANMNVEMGYTFRDNAPYYAVVQKMTTYEDKISVDNNSNSQEITMHLTRAQAQELAALFDPDFLRTLVPENTPGVRRVVESDVDADVY